MASIEQLNALMAEAGAILEVAQVLAFDEGGWTLEVDEDTLLFVDFDADQERVTLSAEAAPVLPAAKAAVHELLLQYNNQWRTTGGVRMALDGPDGSVIQICDLSAAQLNAQAFAETVAIFVDVLFAWREVLSRAPGARDASGELDLTAQGFIRA